MVSKLNEKINRLNEIRHEIKKKRLLFDEGKENFGLDKFEEIIKVKNISQIKGYPYRGYKAKNNNLKDINLALKIVPIDTKYDKKEHPCNLESSILKELTDNVVNTSLSPHITHYLGCHKISNKSKAVNKLNLKRLEVEGKIRNYSNMIISEYVEGGSLDDWIYNTYEEEKEISQEQWKIMVFQLIYTITIMQKKYKMMHNDFHYGNILIDNNVEAKGYIVYKINNKKYYIKNTGIIPKLWDFEFSMAYSDNIPNCYPNKFIIGSYDYDKKKHKTNVPESEIEGDENVPCNYNQVYDLHYFLTSLLDLYISRELFDWILSIYPEEVIPEDETTNSYSKSASASASASTSSNSTSSLNNKLSKLKMTSSDSTEDSTTTNSSSTTDSSKSSSSSSDYNNSSSTSSSETPVYLKEGRLINGTEEIFTLVTPMELLNHDFFKDFLKKPQDFKESECIYFSAGF